MHDLPTLPLDRRQRIADRLLRGETVNATALAAEFQVSEDAVRRDLRALAADGLCRRVYGGALPLSPASSSIRVRTGEDVGRKIALARAALDLVRAGQTVFLDTGSTNVQLAAKLPQNAGLTVVTNSVPAAAALMDRSGVALVVIGGRVDSAIGGSVGARSIAEMRQHRIDLCFLGACAVSIEHGVAGFDMADVDFKRSLIEASAETALMLTSAKLETAAPHRIGRIADIDHLIVEHDAPGPLIAALREAGADVRTAETPHG